MGAPEHFILLSWGTCQQQAVTQPTCLPKLSLILSKFRKMDLPSRKLEFIREFLKLTNEEAISKFEILLKKQKKEAENPFSKEDLINRVKQSEEDFENGNFKTGEELLKRFK